MPEAWSYIARETQEGKKNPRGTVVCAVVDNPEFRKETAKAIGQWVRQGLAIERVPVEWVRLHFLTTTQYKP